MNPVEIEKMPGFVFWNAMIGIQLKRSVRWAFVPAVGVRRGWSATLSATLSAALPAALPGLTRTGSCCFDSKIVEGIAGVR